MEQTKRDDQFLELGLLLMVTGFMVVVVITSLVFVSLRESTIVASTPLTLVVATAISCLLAVLFVLVRRLVRFMVHR